jgi:hypothetical protein
MTIDNQTHSEFRFPSPQLQLSDLLVRAFNIYRRQSKLFWLAAAILWIPFGVETFLLLPDVALGQMHLPSFLYRLAFLQFDNFVWNIYLAAVTLLVLDAVGNRQPSLKIILQKTAGNLTPLFGVTALYLLACLFMAVTVVGIPFAIYFAVAWSLAVPALAVDNLGLRRALSRSRNLIRGRWWRVCGVLAFVLAIGTAAILPEYAVLGSETFRSITPITSVTTFLVKILFSAISIFVLGPVGYCILALLYLDLRAIAEDGIHAI